MRHQKVFLTSIALAAAAILGISATSRPDPIYKNLQILPKDISEHDMDSIMLSYTRALGMGCGFCHNPIAGNEDSLDYVTDKNEMKENARRMMRMTIDINTRYFYFNKNTKPVYLNTVHCKTCHRGEAYPAD
ncbi:MAG: c-type cytochrome [Chitinophagaceae bacterium]|nr:MAG: c-type cytochrome [Chitinophagaceae bacterium]